MATAIRFRAPDDWHRELVDQFAEVIEARIGARMSGRPPEDREEALSDVSHHIARELRDPKHRARWQAAARLSRGKLEAMVLNATSLAIRSYCQVTYVRSRSPNTVLSPLQDESDPILRAVEAQGVRHDAEPDDAAARAIQRTLQALGQLSDGDRIVYLASTVADLSHKQIAGRFPEHVNSPIASRQRVSKVRRLILEVHQHALAAELGTTISPQEHERLLAYIDGRLDPHAHDALQRHLRFCSVCAAILAAEAAARRELHHIFAPGPLLALLLPAAAGAAGVAGAGTSGAVVASSGAATTASGIGAAAGLATTTKGILILSALLALSAGGLLVHHELTEPHHHHHPRPAHTQAARRATAFAPAPVTSGLGRSLRTSTRTASAVTHTIAAHHAPATAPPHVTPGASAGYARGHIPLAGGGLTYGAARSSASTTPTTSHTAGGLVTSSTPSSTVSHASTPTRGGGLTFGGP